MDEYVAFMNKYKSTTDATALLSMMGSYYSMMSKYSDFCEEIDAINEDDLTTAELAYYLEVTGRVSKKLLNAALG